MITLSYTSDALYPVKKKKIKIDNNNDIAIGYRMEMGISNVLFVFVK